uniref:Uncharacterized protein n=1 Tax=Arundo donax TaxID=35708 RepID=A0A0A9H9Z4_ARUDO
MISHPLRKQTSRLLYTPLTAISSSL